MPFVRQASITAFPYSASFAGSSSWGIPMMQTPLTPSRAFITVLPVPDGTLDHLDVLCLEILSPFGYICDDPDVVSFRLEFGYDAFAIGPEVPPRGLSCCPV